jgi:hypothetical protein
MPKLPQRKLREFFVSRDRSQSALESVLISGRLEAPIGICRRRSLHQHRADQVRDGEDDQGNSHGDSGFACQWRAWRARGRVPDPGGHVHLFLAATLVPKLGVELAAVSCFAPSVETARSPAGRFAKPPATATTIAME